LYWERFPNFFFWRDGPEVFDHFVFSLEAPHCICGEAEFVINFAICRFCRPSVWCIIIYLIKNSRAGSFNAESQEGYVTFGKMELKKNQFFSFFFSFFFCKKKEKKKKEKKTFFKLSTSAQARLPAELKHINKRRKRN